MTMRIGGLEKNSLIDFPPGISCVIFTTGCNFACPYCHNPGLVAPGADDACLYSEADIFSFLDRRKQLLDGVVISGGEPTLHADLPDFCRRVKQMGYAVKLDTNGSFPEAIAQLIADGLVDYVAMDLKTAPAKYRDYIAADADPAAISTAVRTILQSGLAHEFRTTCVRPIVDAEAIDAIAGLVRGAQSYALQKPHAANPLDPSFFENHEWQISDDELQCFQHRLSKFVDHCIIR
ncbi:MAG: anaerobic ribonucleoside-triphosphate reductase activating protein [Thermodesulfobacteriota bacterium]